MTVMRAKMWVGYVEPLQRNEDGSVRSEYLSLYAVCPKGGYPEDGTDENHSYARWTPQADFRLTIQNPELIGKFKVGDEFYVDFTRVE